MVDTAILQTPLFPATILPDFDTTATLRFELFHVTFLAVALDGRTCAVNLTERPRLASFKTAFRLSFFLPLYSVTDFTLTDLPT